MNKFKIRKIAVRIALFIAVATCLLYGYFITIDLGVKEGSLWGLAGVFLAVICLGSIMAFLLYALFKK